MARLARDRKTEVNVLVDVDLGLKRCGMPPGEPAAALAKMVVGSGLKFRGLMGYEGQLHPLLPGPDKERAVTEAMQALARTKTLIESGGIPAGIFSCGGTGDYSIAGAYAGVTENQAGVVGLTRAMAADYAPDHIRVNAIVPGTIDTPMNAIALADPKNRARYAEMAPACRLGTPEDLSGIAVYLASEDSSYCVGGIFTVDGGLTAV